MSHSCHDESHSHNHDHGDHDHDHDHMRPEDGEQNLLYSRIDLDKVEFKNAEDGAKPGDLIKPWDQRNEGETFIKSDVDVDEQLIIKVPFTGSVKLRSIIIRGGGGGTCPKLVKLYINKDVDFNSASTMESVQDIEIAQHRDAIEYSLRTAKFPNVRDITLFVSSNHGDDVTQMHFLGFKGSFTELTSRAPVNVVYELQRNPADYQKIEGDPTRMGK